MFRPRRAALPLAASAARAETSVLAERHRRVARPARVAVRRPAGLAVEAAPTPVRAVQALAAGLIPVRAVQALAVGLAPLRAVLVLAAGLAPLRAALVLAAGLAP